MYLHNAVYGVYIIYTYSSEDDYNMCGKERKKNYFLKWNLSRDNVTYITYSNYRK